MKNRSKLFSHFRDFCAEIHTQFHVYVQNLRSDNAKEYMFEQFQSFMLQNDILHQTSCVDTPSQNGVAEKKIDTFLKPLELYYFKCTCPNTSGPMLFPLLVFCLIGCLPQSWLGALRFKPSFLINLCFPLSLGCLGVLFLFRMFVRMCLNSILLGK